MKYFLFLLLICQGSAKSQPALADSTIKLNSLQGNLFFLSQDSLKGRLTGAEGAAIAARFIAAKFDSIGLKPLPGNEGYFDHFIAEYEGKKIPAKNVIGMLAGKVTNDTIVIFSAHYDHIGQKNDLPFNKDYNYKDAIFNGANDNATGVVALIELAKYYKAQNNNRYSLLFVAFSGEEMNMLGSAHLVEKINTRAVKAMINLEMLGRPFKQNCFVISLSNNNILNNLNRYFKSYQQPKEKKFFINDPFPDENLAERSDHYPFAREIKNAFTIMGSSPADIYYHSVDDEYDTIDFYFLLKATKNIAMACEQFVK